MKKTILSLILAGALCGVASAQTDQNRTIPTKIADLLAKAPADDSAQLIQNAMAVADLSEAGLTELVKQLNQSGDKSRLHYAISGFSFYATQPGRENWRSMATNGYGKSLSQITDPVEQQFVIFQLQQVAKNDAIAYLKPYIHNDRLADAVSRALAAIGTPEAHQELHAALGSSSGPVRLAIVQALGYAGYQPAAADIRALVKNNPTDASLEKAGLYALASMADPASESLLANAARQSGYRYTNSEATAAYLHWLGKQNANSATTKKISGLLAGLQAGEQTGTRIALLKLLTEKYEPGAQQVLLNALKDKNIAYRQAALRFAGPLMTESNAGSWLKAMPSLSPVAKAELTNALAAKGIKAAAAPALQLLGSKDPAIRSSVMNAAVQLAGDKALPVLATLLKSADANEARSIRNALLLADSKAAVELASAAMGSASNEGKAAMIEVLGERAAAGQTINLLPLLNSEIPTLKTATAAALPNMVAPDHLPQLFPLLAGGATGADLSNRQDILISALKGIKDPADQSARLLSAYRSATTEQQPRYYRVMAGLGSPALLAELAAGFESAAPASQLAMVEAMGGWKDGAALHTLFNLGKKAGPGTLGSAIVNAFTRQVGSSKASGENKYLMIRDMMPLATEARQQSALLNALGRISTYPSLLYTAGFLQNPSLKGAAANAIMNSCLANNQLRGAKVHQLLEQAMATVSGGESEYQKAAVRKHLATLSKDGDFDPLFNGNDLGGWKGLVGNPITRAKMDAATLAAEQAKADETMRKGWSVENGLLVFNGQGDNLCTEKKYRDFELYIDWKISKDGDAGIYLRGTPQVQIWDTTRRDVGAEVGSGGLYNNQKNPSKPLVLADNAIGDWNQFRIIMEGDQVTVYLNGQLVVDKVPLENYWDRTLPLFREEQIELQAHGTYVAYRDIYLREINSPEPYVLTPAEKEAGFKVLFDGTSLNEWTGNKSAYIIEDGNLAVYPKRGGNGNLYTKDQYSDFVYRFEFKLTPGANNGVGLRAPLEGDAAYEGMEVQILDNDADIYKNLQPYQYHGSVYGVITAKRGFLKPMGEWNEEEIELKGNKIKVTLNGTVITEGDLAEVSANGTLDHRDHPGLKRTTGHIGFLGHGDTLFFRNIRIKDLSQKEAEPVKKKKRKSKKN